MSTPKRTITQRVMLADRVVHQFGHDGEDRLFRLIDLLASFRHWCDRRGLCFGDLDRRAYARYLKQLHQPSTKGISMTSEPTNAERAEWAKEALAVFTARTYSGDHPDTMGRHDLDCAISDLICDLMHFARRESLDIGATVQQAFRNFAAELHGEEIHP